MTEMVFGATKVWWYVSRSTGIVAWALLALAVLWGLALSTRALGRKTPGPWLLDVHRFFGGLAVIFTIIHFVTLSFDPYMSTTYGYEITQAFVPFASKWKPGPMAWGIVAFYLLLAVELTSLLKKRLPQKFWRGVHLASYALYAMATVHLLTAGTEKQNPLMRWSVLVTVGAVVFFTVYRIIGPGRTESVKQSGPKKSSPTN
ncbi:MAG: ferric reductase-like transmembrane domain-containing protein [Actinobacteria bacterium]|nr:ferric reductase-like transmembrane domain-containing protein [Actinomycetota bacterium]